MKIFIFLSLLLTTCCRLAAQAKIPGAKAHVFQRSSIPGANPKGIVDENGKEVKKELEPAITWYIYLEYDRKHKLEPYRVWISGQPHSVRYEQVSSPVLLKQPGIGNKFVSDTLVGKTRNRLLQIFPEAEALHVEKKATDSIKNKYVVIEYFLDGKKQSCVVREIKKLPPLILQ